MRALPIKVSIAVLTAASLLSACGGVHTRPVKPPPIKVPDFPPGTTGGQRLPRGYVCEECETDFIRTAFAPPAHGVMLVRGGFMTPAATWIVVDYDAHRLSRIITSAAEDAQQRFMLQAMKREDAPLSDAEMSRLQGTADHVWEVPRSLMSKPASDITWSLYLIDGRAMRHDFGIGLPGDTAAALADDLDALVRRHFGG